MNIVEIKNLKKVYKSGTIALDGINLSIKKGDFYALLGSNGAGKTTLIGIITDLVNKTSGEINIFGKNIETQLDDIKLNVGVVPQEFNFNMFEKVIDILVNQAGYFGIRKKEALSRAEKILKKLNLWEKRNSTGRTLSGGMKRRVMIARSLINSPKLLILDEPTAGVDIELRHSMWEYLRALNRDSLTILLTTHYLEEVEQMCNKMAMIKDGVIVKEGNVSDIISEIDNRNYVLNAIIPKNYTFTKNYNVKKIDDANIEITLNRDESLISALTQIEDRGLKIIDIRPKQNAVESFFLSTVKK